MNDSLTATFNSSLQVDTSHYPSRLINKHKREVFGWFPERRSHSEDTERIKRRIKDQEQEKKGSEAAFIKDYGICMWLSTYACKFKCSHGLLTISQADLRSSNFNHEVRIKKLCTFYWPNVLTVNHIGD